MICPECNGTGTAIYYCRETGNKFEDICHTCHGSRCKPQTNADRIRAMSDEELAEVIAGLVCVGHCVVSCSCSECFLEKICGEDIGVVEVLDFLKQPVKDGEGE